MSERIQATEAAYDAVAKDFAARVAGTSEGAMNFLRCLEERLTSSSLVLDAGCGPGHHATHLAHAGHRVIALDRSLEMLRFARDSMPLRSDLGTLPVATDSLDAIWSCAALLHVDEGDLDGVFDEWSRALRHDGWLALATSLGDTASWEDVPAAASKVPSLPDGQRRWFVHHTATTIEAHLTKRGWTVAHRSIRHSTRDWIEIIARR